MAMEQLMLLLMCEKWAAKSGQNPLLLYMCVIPPEFLPKKHLNYWENLISLIKPES